MAAGAVAVAAERRVVREPLFLVLLSLGVLSALSAFWTVGGEGRTLRAAAVTAGLAGVFLAAAVAGRDGRGRALLAVGLAAIAVVCGVVGLWGALAHEEPYGLFIAGGWRPAGTFEYPPALALLMASAIPLFAAALWQRDPLTGRIAATVGLVVAGGVLVTAHSRTGLALGIAIAAFSVPGVRRGAGRAGWRLAAVALVAAVVGSLAFSGGDGPSSGFLHAREDTWRAGLEAFADRPLVGAGADSFLAASARYQDGSAIRFAHNLPLDFAVDLGIAGLLIALALYWFSIRLVYAARASRAAWLFGPAVLAFLASNLLDWPWHLAGAGAVWALAAGSLAGCDEEWRSRVVGPKPQEGDT